MDKTQSFASLDTSSCMLCMWAGPTPRDPVRCRATKPEASDNAEQSKGGRMNLLISNYGRNETTPRPNPRVKSEASENYNMARGKLSHHY